MKEINIYDMYQADFYISKGVKPIGAGVNSRKKAYVTFVMSETNEVYGEWLSIPLNFIPYKKGE
ncbi:MAG: hypothetical protein ACRDDY_19455 [Clostridium sp.]|uniref:hypothetical protein n=1 Tax=Clostridium sp. TaxID=1506 RepID=UPI003EE71244